MIAEIPQVISCFISTKSEIRHDHAMSCAGTAAQLGQMLKYPEFRGAGFAPEIPDSLRAPPPGHVSDGGGAAQ
jgi:hypothetical protein